jgi:hypothetical protein
MTATKVGNDQLVGQRFHTALHCCVTTSSVSKLCFGSLYSDKQAAHRNMQLPPSICSRRMSPGGTIMQMPRTIQSRGISLMNITVLLLWTLEVAFVSQLIEQLPLPCHIL